MIASLSTLVSWSASLTIIKSKKNLNKKEMKKKKRKMEGGPEKEKNVIVGRQAGRQVGR